MTWRDGLATAFILVAIVIYALWLAGVEVFGLGVRGIGAIVLGLGLAASVIAVVYGVGAGLLDAHKAYLAAASVIGVLAGVVGVATLLDRSETMLGALVVATVALWAMATVRHAITKESSTGERAVSSFKEAA
jgi:hypothetical protein